MLTLIHISDSVLLGVEERAKESLAVLGEMKLLGSERDGDKEAKKKARESGDGLGRVEEIHLISGRREIYCQVLELILVEVDLRRKLNNQMRDAANREAQRQEQEKEKEQERFRGVDDKRRIGRERKGTIESLLTFSRKRASALSHPKTEDFPDSSA